MTRILAATSMYPDESGKTGRPNAVRLRAFCHGGYTELD